MTVVVDISCPACGEKEDLQKLDLSTYRCGECGEEFTQTDVEP